jgi:hypothetical protein
MATFTPAPTLLAQSLKTYLEQLRDARSDGDPTHDPFKCGGPCRICTAERALNRLLDRLPRKDKPSWPIS